MTRRVILDLSGYQPVPDYARLRRECPEVQAIILKVSEGRWGTTNANFEPQYAGAVAAGYPVGGYLFDHVSVDGPTEAATFEAKLVGKKLFTAWLDFEANDSNASPAQVSAHVADVLGRLNASHPMRAGIYTAPWAWNPWTASADFSHYPLWLAGYTANLPASPAHWGPPILWQFTDKYPTYFGGVDASIFQGTDAQWDWLMTGKTTAPTTPGGADLYAMPNITATDHTHPKSLALWKTLLKVVNPASDVSTDAATNKTTEQFRSFFKVTASKPGRIDQVMWDAAEYLASGGGK